MLSGCLPTGRFARGLLGAGHGAGRGETARREKRGEGSSTSGGLEVRAGSSERAERREQDEGSASVRLGASGRRSASAQRSASARLGASERSSTSDESEGGGAMNLQQHTGERSMGNGGEHGGAEPSRGRGGDTTARRRATTCAQRSEWMDERRESFAGRHEGEKPGMRSEGDGGRGGKEMRRLMVEHTNGVSRMRASAQEGDAGCERGRFKRSRAPPSRMSATRPQRSTAIAFAGRYEEGSSAVSYGPSGAAAHLPLRWQVMDEANADEEEEAAAEEEEEIVTPVKKKARDTREGPRVARREAIATATAAAADPTQSKETAAEQHAELCRWMQQERNVNTNATYVSGWKQFIHWVRNIANARRAAGQGIDEERPAEADVAAYMRFMVTVKGSPMTSVTAARAAIADHLRMLISPTYNPCQGRLVELMTQVLTPRATPSVQKREMSTVLMDQIMAVLEQEAMILESEEEQKSIWRDRTAIMLGYFCFLRTSEVARMVRKDVTFKQEWVGGKEVRVMHVFVNPLCKNDKKRLGHTRCVQELEAVNSGPGVRKCMVRSMAEYLERTQKGAKDTDPLFPRQRDGGQMSADGPRGRLHFWLRKLRVPEAEEYGFHSLRAGAATAVAQAGVPEQSIKLAGNWKSDNGVRPYIRPQLEDRLRASDALGAKRKAPAAAAAGY